MARGIEVIFPYDPGGRRFDILLLCSSMSRCKRERSADRDQFDFSGQTCCVVSMSEAVGRELEMDFAVFAIWFGLVHTKITSSACGCNEMLAHPLRTCRLFGGSRLLSHPLVRPNMP